MTLVVTRAAAGTSGSPGWLPPPTPRRKGHRHTVLIRAARSIRGRYHSGESNAGGSGGFVSLPSSSAAVLSVTVPGRPASAVYLPRFSYPRKHLSLPGEALPALVSAADPRDVEIRWDEMTPLGDQIAGRMADSARANNQLIVALSEQIQAATAQPRGDSALRRMAPSCATSLKTIFH